MAVSTVPPYPYANPVRNRPAPTLALPAAGNDPLSEANAVRKMGVLFTLAFVFLYVSRVTDLRFSYLHLPFIVAAMAGATAALSGCLPAAIQSRTGLIYAAMTFWICAGVPFSVWRGGSFAIITQYWVRTVLIALLVLALVVSFKEVSRLMDTIALAVLVAAFLGLHAGVSSADGRLEIANYSRISNPNDMAFAMLLGMPLWWRNLTWGSLLRRCMAAAALLPILACFLKTGSRAGLFALASMTVVAFLRAPVASKIRIGTGAVLAAAIGLAVLPPYLRDRYFTLETANMADVHSSLGERAVDAAAASALQRKNNLMDSIRMTLHHPVFGVGAGNFAVEQDQDAKAAGLARGTWLGTHNTYTQLSSECGIPMLVLFLLLLAGGMRALGAARRLAARETGPEAAGILKAAQALDLVMWGTCVFIFFSHIGYDMTTYLLVSLSLVLARAANRELAHGATDTGHRFSWPAKRQAPKGDRLPHEMPQPRRMQGPLAGIPLSALRPASGSALRKAARRSETSASPPSDVPLRWRLLPPATRDKTP
jgi:hypothetical protein